MAFRKTAQRVDVKTDSSRRISNVYRVALVASVKGVFRAVFQPLFRFESTRLAITRALTRALFACVLFVSMGGADLSGADPASGGVPGIASREVIRRQQQVDAAQSLFTTGSKAFSDRSYGEAMDYFKAAFETTPDVPATAEMRRAFFKRYQSASLAFAEVLIDEAKWGEAEGALDDVMVLAEKGGLPRTSVDPRIRRTLENLKKKDYYNMADSPRHHENVDEVKKKLTLANGYLELGEYDRALRAFRRALAVDPTNSAARRGMEKAERHMMDYADVARDHARAANLRAVAQGWEQPVPDLATPDFVTPSGADLPRSGRDLLEAKLKKIIIPRLEFNGARLRDVLEFLTQKSQELDLGEPDPAKKGVNIVVDSSGAQENFLDRPLTVQVSRLPLGVALKYVTGQVGMKYRVDDFAVSVVPLSAVTDAGMVVRKFSVPPGFIQGGGTGDDSGGGGNADPFAPPADKGGGTLVKRVTAQEFLKQNGVIFGPGAVAQYIGGTLVVKNTPEQIAIVESMVQAAKDGGSKNVKVDIKMISIRDDILKLAGLDFLLGAGSLGSSSVFFGGGTNGNSNLPARAVDYPAIPGLPVVGAGLTPVTSGLRTGVANAPTIDSILVGATARNGVAPAVFSVAGVFTSPQFQTVLRLLDQQKGTDTLCDSHVIVNPGQKARIEQVREFIYPTEYDPPEIPNQIGGVIGGIITAVPSFVPVTPATPTAFETRPLGKILEVEPVVSEDNRTISVNILTDFADFSGFINYGTPIAGRTTLVGGVLTPTVLTANRILMPVFDVVRETTDISVWDGQTIAIGGFHGDTVTDIEDKIPVAGDAPLLGKGFSSSSSQHQKRALLIFVSVRLIDPGGNPINAQLDKLASQD